MKPKNKALGILAGAVCFMIWGGVSPALVKSLPIDGPLISLFGIICGCLFSWLPFIKKSFGNYDKKTWLTILAAGVSGACVFLFSHLAYQATTISTAMLVFSTMPFLTQFVFGPLYGYPVPSRSKFLYLLVGFVGLVIAFWGPLAFNHGAAFALIASSCFGIYNVLMKSMEDKVPPSEFMFFTMLIGLNFTWMFVLVLYLMGSISFAGLPLLLKPVYGLILVAFGIINFALANLLYLYASKNSSLTTVTTLGYTEPFWGVLAGILFFGEILTMQFVIGISMVLYCGYKLMED